MTADVTLLEEAGEAVGHGDMTGIRREAGRVLEQLLIDRALSERRLAETGRSDPLKMLTGAGALDHAVAATCQIIRRIDLTQGTPAPVPARDRPARPAPAVPVPS